jgi:hypothetical protein
MWIGFLFFRIGDHLKDEICGLLKDILEIILDAKFEFITVVFLKTRF